jgi:hypothetical protein
MNDEDNQHSINLLDMVRGYSVLIHLNKTYYFKHFSVVDLLEFDYLQARDIAESVRAGIEKEKDLIDLNIKRGCWSVSKEEKIKALDWTIKRSMSALNKIKDLTQRRVFHEQIQRQEEDLNKLKTERAKMCAYSAESLSEVKRIKRMTEGSIFLDKDFTQKPPAEHEASLMAVLFSRYQELNNREAVLKASYFGGFFEVFAAQGGNSAQLIGRTFCEMTNLQKNLIVLTNALLNKLKNTQIPDEIAGDPIKIMDYEEREGGEEKTSHGVEDLKIKMKARGGKLKAEDFLS